jgi:hypothetical protein
VDPAVLVAVACLNLNCGPHGPRQVSGANLRGGAKFPIGRAIKASHSIDDDGSCQGRASATAVTTVARRRRRRPPRGFVIGAEIIGALDREHLCQPTAGPVAPALDSADGAAADLGGFFVGKARGADEDEGSAGSWLSARRNLSNSRWLV